MYNKNSSQNVQEMVIVMRKQMQVIAILLDVI